MIHESITMIGATIIGIFFAIYCIWDGWGLKITLKDGLLDCFMKYIYPFIVLIVVGLIWLICF